MRASLLPLLRSHHPTNPAEALHQRRMLALLEAPGDPFARAAFAPGHFTASAFVLSPDASALLLILHGKLHRWLQPGGHIDPGDADLLDAARRETREETGLQSLLPGPGGPLLDLDVHPIPANPRKGEPAHEHFDLRVLLQSESWAFEAGSDAAAARWVPLGEVEREETDESVLRAVRHIRELLASR